MYLIINKKSAAVALVCTLIIMAVVVSIIIPQGAVATAASAKSIGWGLVYGESGTQPRGEVAAEELKPYDAYYIGAADKKVIYLTFDSGYENGNTPALLDALKKHNVPAAFFVLGSYIETNPDLILRIVNEGHIVCNHTRTHPDITKFTDISSFRNELESLEKIYKEATGKDMPKYFRPPEGKFSMSNLQMAQDMGYTTVFWSLTYVDWQVNNQPSREEALEKLTPRIHPGAVVLLHSTSSTNAQILDELLTRWESNGYVFGTLDELCK